MDPKRLRSAASTYSPISGILPPVLALFASVTGCSFIADRPELNPDKLAAQTVDRPWAPAPSVASHYEPYSALAVPPQLQTGRSLSLANLIDLALVKNPETRRTWEAARSAAAEYGAAQAPYYPQVDVQSSNGYQRTAFGLPGTAPALKQWQAEPVAEMT